MDNTNINNDNTNTPSHPQWKNRVAAFEEAARRFQASADENDSCFRAWSDPMIWKKAVCDTNAVAQESALSALVSFLLLGADSRSRSVVVPCIIEKCLAAPRAATRQKALDILLAYVELELPDPVIDDLVAAQTAKQPKIVAAAIGALREILFQFGTRSTNPKPILKSLPHIFAHPDNTVRAEAHSLAVELYRWLGDALRPSLAQLKPLQLKDLDAAFKLVERKPPLRFLRNQKDQKEQQEETELVMEVDPFDLTDAVDVLRSVPKDLSDLLASSKWKERKDALDALLVVVKVPRIMEGDFSEVVRLLAKAVTDPNVAVVTVSAQCITSLALGLRSGFKYSAVVLPPMIERLKETKQSVCDAICTAMDAVFAASALTDVLDDIVSGLAHKNPKVKQESLKFLARSLQQTLVFPSKGEQKIIADHSVKLLSDTAEQVRAAAALCLGTLMKILGERAMGPYLEAVEEIRKQKIKETFESVQVKAKPPPKKDPLSKSKPTDSKGTKPKPSLHKPSESKSIKPKTDPPRPPSTLKSRIARPGTVAAPSTDTSESRPQTPKTAPSSTPNISTPANPPLRALISRPLTKPPPQESSELASLQLKNAQLIEQHTNDMLTLKMNENYLSRAKNDIERLTSKITSLEKALEAANSRADSAEKLLKERESALHAVQLRQPSNGKENTHIPPADSTIQSWKRAAEVTAQLKARIEQMKRQDNSLP